MSHHILERIATGEPITFDLDELCQPLPTRSTLEEARPRVVPERVANSGTPQASCGWCGRACEVTCVGSTPMCGNCLGRLYPDEEQGAGPLRKRLVIALSSEARRRERAAAWAEGVMHGALVVTAVIVFGLLARALLARM